MGFVASVFLLVALALVSAGMAAARARRSIKPFWVLAVLPLTAALVLTVYVFGEDDYRDNGISRWDAYRSPGGELGEAFLACVALALLSAAAIAYAAAAQRRAILLGATFASAALVVAFIPVMLGFSLN